MNRQPKIKRHAAWPTSNHPPGSLASTIDQAGDERQKDVGRQGANREHLPAQGKTKLTIARLDDATIEGTFATTKPVSLSSVSYSFDLTFKVSPAKQEP